MQNFVFDGKPTGLAHGDRIVWNRKAKFVQVFRPLPNGKFGALAFKGDVDAEETITTDFGMNEMDSLPFMREVLIGMEMLGPTLIMSPARKKGDDIVEWIIGNPAFCVCVNGEVTMLQEGDKLMWQRDQNVFTAFRETSPEARSPIHLMVGDELIERIHGEEFNLPNDVPLDVMGNLLTDGVGYCFLGAEFGDVIERDGAVEWKVTAVA